MAPSNRTTKYRVSNGLVALGSAAVMAVYSAGYLATRAAAQRLSEQERRRPPIPAPAESGPAIEMPEPPASATLASAPAAEPTPQNQTPELVARAEAPAPTVPAVGSTTERAPVTAATRTADTVDAATIASSGTAPKAPSAPAVAANTSAEPASAAPVAVVAANLSATPAAATTEAPAAAAPAAAPGLLMPKVAYRDGAYSGYGTSRHGDIQASVTIEGGRITSAVISKCYTRYPCTWIEKLPPQVVQIQSAEVDFITGATVSTYAFYYAILEALSKAQ